MKILLVDLSAVFWWKWHGSAGAPIDTAFEYTVGKVHQLSNGYDVVAVCCDTGRSFRYDILDTYKGNRPPRDPAALEQLARVKGALRERGFHLVGAEGFEADDVIATATKLARALSPLVEVVIAGSDKDLFQLVGPGVSFLSLHTETIIDAAGVEAKLGVPPRQVRDLLAMMGDAADNIKGVKGVGRTHAARLLGQFGSIDGILSALPEVVNGEPVIGPPSIRRALTERVAELEIARQLVSLRDDVPIDFADILTHGRSPDVDNTEAQSPTTEEPTMTEAAAPDTAPQQQPSPQPAPSPPPAQPRAVGRFSAASVTRKPDRSAEKFILTGRSGIGKTFLLSTVPDVFILPVEEGLKGASPDHEPAHFEHTPRSLKELHTALDVFVGDINRPVDGKRPHRHLAIDSLSGVETLVHEAACEAERVKHMEAQDFKKLWTAAQPLWLAVQRKLDAIRHTGVHVWLIAHSSETVDSNTEGETFRKWDLLFKGSEKSASEVRQLWRQWADHIFFLDWVAKVSKGGKGKRSVGRYEGRVLYTRESATHYAKTRARLPPSIPATWDDLRGALAKGVVAPEQRLRAEIGELMNDLADEQAAAIEAMLKNAQTNTQLAAVLSRAQGMRAVALENEPDTTEPDEEAAAPAA